MFRTLFASILRSTLYSTITQNYLQMEPGWRNRYIDTRLRTGPSRFRIRVGARGFSFLHTVHTGSGSHPASSFTGRLSPPPPVKAAVLRVKLTTHLHLMLRLRMSGAVILILLNAFMVQTGKT
jgi:hypothetical protein